MISSNDIINAKKCGDIFPQDVTQTKELYKKLAKMYHPDLCKLENANEIFAKISTLYNSALDNLEKGSWEVSSMVELKSSSGKCYTLRYLSRFDFELGECYIGNKKVVYILNEDKKKYFNRYLETILRLEYKNKEMRDEFERYLPNVLTSFDMKDGKYCIILNKTDDVYSLKDVLSYYGGSIPEKHVAWIVSRLYNLLCYLNYNNLTLNGLDINSLFICPRYHTVCIYGGWWYATTQGDKMIGTNKDVYDAMTIKSKTTKQSDVYTDLECVKLLAIKLYGNTTSINSHIIEWLNKPTQVRSPLKEWGYWNEHLDNAYGKRKFIEMEIDKNKLYKED